jgi:hypothetical protein
MKYLTAIAVILFYGSAFAQVVHDENSTAVAAGKLNTDGSNATLPDVLNNFGIGKTYVYGANSGMICDNVFDNTSALQAAVNLARALAFPATGNGGGVLVLPAGLCHVSGTINITSGISIVGAGKGSNQGTGNTGGTVIRDTRTTGDVFAVASLGAVTIRDLYIDSDTPKTSGACLSYTGTGGSTYNERSYVDSVICSNAWDGIRLDSAYAFKTNNFESINHGHDGILKINTIVKDGGEDAYTATRLRCLNRCTTGTEGNNAFTTVNTTPTVTVAHTAHGMSTGQIAIWYGATVFNNITIHGYYPVTVVDANTFTITADTNANASSAGGGTPTYWYGNTAGFEFRAGGDIAIVGSKLIGNGFGFLANMTTGPTGTVRISADSLEENRISPIGVIQAISGVEYGNVIITGNQMSSIAAQPVLSNGLYVGIGTPNTASKWVRNITYTGNAHNDSVSSGSVLNLLDGTGYSITGNVWDNNGTAGGTVLNVGSAALSVAYSGNQLIGTPSGEFTSTTMNWSAIDFKQTPAPSVLLNGGAEVDQVNESLDATRPYATPTGGNTNTLDGWIIGSQTSATGSPTTTRSADAPPGAQHSIKYTVGTGGSAPTAGQRTFFWQKIEANNIRNWAFGAAGANTLTFSAWMKSSVTGTYGVALINAAATRAYFQNCALTAATWTKCVIVIPGDTAGTWIQTGVAAGAGVRVLLECGSTFQGTAATWAASDIECSSAQTALTTTSAATFQMGNVKLEVSPVPTPFIPLQYKDEIEIASRYYAKTFPQGTAVAQTGGLAGSLCTVGESTTIATLGVEWRFPVEMRASPTIVTYNPSAGNANWRNVTGAADATVSVDIPVAKGTTGVPIGEITTAPVIASNYCIHATADARL